MTSEDFHTSMQQIRQRRVGTEGSQEWSLSPLRHYHMDQEPWVSVSPELVHTAGDANAGLLLADIVRFLPADDEDVLEKPGFRIRRDGRMWLVKPQAALVSETGLTDDQVKRGLAKLRDNGLIERLGHMTLLRPTRELSTNSDSVVKVYAGIVRLSGNAARGLVLSQMNFWFSPGEDQRVRVTQRRGEHRWLAKRYEELAAETGLTRNQAVSAVNNLRSRGLIHTSVHLFSGLSSLHLRFDEEEVRQAWEEQHTAWWESQARQRSTGHVEL
jgi:DNA-binding MarR family transcriptional regulator